MQFIDSSAEPEYKAAIEYQGASCSGGGRPNPNVILPSTWVLTAEEEEQMKEVLSYANEVLTDVTMEKLRGVMSHCFRISNDAAFHDVLADAGPLPAAGEEYGRRGFQMWPHRPQWNVTI